MMYAPGKSGNALPRGLIAQQPITQLAGSQRPHWCERRCILSVHNQPCYLAGFVRHQSFVKESPNGTSASAHSAATCVFDSTIPSDRLIEFSVVISAAGG